MVVVPTYNEHENLPDLLGQILALPIDVQVVVVDDNSPDGTGALADEWATKDARVKVLHRLTERGRASGLVGPEVMVDAGATAQDRLLAAMGRQP